MKMNGAQIIMECLKEQKVDTVFGFPGGAVLNIYDELYKSRDKIKHILTAHEQGAAHAADGYARASGKVGVCIATSGPGATNLVTGIATAYMDSSPMVAITGNVPVSLLGKDSFQEVDIAGITMPITKHNYIVKDITKLADIIREAFYIAQEGRQGPVLIDVPKDLTAAVTEYEYKEPKPISRHSDMIRKEDIDKAIKMIETAKRPVIYIGGGVIRSKASKELMEFVEKIQAPVGVSLMGKGAFPAIHDFYTGMIGMHGSKVSNMSVSQSDLLVVIGARFSDRVVSRVDRFAQKAKILHIDIDPAEINKNIPTFHHVIGDIQEVLKVFNTRIKKKINHDDWLAKIAAWKIKYPIRITIENRRPKEIISAVHDVLDSKAVIVTEVGQHQMWVAQFYKFSEPDTFITSGGLGTMGFGTGAAIGAQMGRPDRRVVSIAGDGSFQMNCSEIATAAKYNIPIVVLIMNNHTLGMVRQWQTLFYEGRYSETTLDHKIDWVKLAEAFGAVGMTMSAKDDPSEVIRKALAVNGPVVVDCEIPIDDIALPMVAPGQSIEHVILSVDPIVDPLSD
ncbi:MAG: biosynthetic-type acetolactate synthase large subunit [Bacteroidetes bacterium]|nr:biosynthetic-type acetolactate synthase large subunit [Bacteroidota bacterium]